MSQQGESHNMFIGYVLWIFGFMGAHRFYFGKPISGIIWLFTLGLFLIGWIVDLFLIPQMDREADGRFQTGAIDYNLAWLLLWFLGLLGIQKPEEYGGMGLDILFSSINWQEQAYAGTTGPGWALHSEIVAPYLVNYGTEEQKQEWLPKMVSGDAITGEGKIARR